MRLGPVLAMVAVVVAGPPLGGLHAQERLVTRTGEAEVAIYEDNLDDARRRAIHNAQETIMRREVERLVAREWRELYDTELKQRVFSRPNRYISAFRVRQLETSLDRTQYTAQVEAQVYRARLIHDLRALSLPLKGRRRYPLGVYYPAGDPLLSHQAVRQAVLGALRARLELLNLEVTEVTAVPPDASALLGTPYRRQSARRDWLRRQALEIPAVVFVAFGEPDSAPAADAGGDETATPRAQVEAIFYQVHDGSAIAALNHPAERLPAPGAQGEARQAVAAAMDTLVQPLLNELQPGRIGDPETWSADGGHLEIRVLGLGSIYDEESFEREFFGSGGPFGTFVLSRIAADSVTYAGRYRGDARALPGELRGDTYGPFRVREVFWHNHVLELVVERRREPETADLKPYPPEARPAQVQSHYQRLRDAHPALAEWGTGFAEVEDNGRLDQANPMYFDAALFGFIDSRADSDFYVGEALRAGEELEIAWFRMGRTNLSPALRLYDEQGMLVKTLFPTGRLQVRYRLPEGEHRFYLEVGDRFGYLNWESGGYLNYHYLMRVHRLHPEAPATTAEADSG